MSLGVVTYASLSFILQMLTGAAKQDCTVEAKTTCFVKTAIMNFVKGSTAKSTDSYGAFFSGECPA